MDAKPHRARVAIPAMGIENMSSAIHQRHKSTGNLNAASRTGGLHAAAKRTVFGDVSNVVKNLANSSGQAPLGKGHGEVPLKTNIHQAAQGFAKPAQRPNLTAAKVEPRPIDYCRPPQISNGSKSVTVLNDALADGERQADNRAPIALDLSDTLPLAGVNASLAGNNVLSDDLVEPSVSSSISTLTLQPRHHKSQPALKKEAEAQILRRTQSKHFAAHTAELKDQEPCKYLDDVTEASYEDALEHLLEDQASGLEDLEGRDETIEKPAAVHVTSQAPCNVEIDPKLVLSGEQSRSPTIAGVEEYWDELEDEELYDDQGYTTAHSYRSRGDLTTSGATVMVAPKVTDAVERELEVARQYVDVNRTQDDIDDDLWDVCMVAEYGEDIFGYLRELEEKLLPDPHYMDHQTEIQWSMRAVLMDWLVQVHGRFSLLPETLFLTINYIDRFLSYKAVSIGKLQLVGATALLIAAKYEEINCPSLEEIVFMVDGSYSVDEILKAERFMLSMLGFELGWPGPMSFLRRISKADEYDLETRTLAKYFLEVTIMDERFVASPPSFVAAGAHCISRLMLKKGDWTLGHVHYSGYTWTQLRPLVTMMLECCYQPRKHHLSIYEKYTDKRYKRASQYVEAEIAKGFMIPGGLSASGHHRVPELGAYDADLPLVQHSHTMMPVELRS